MMIAAGMRMKFEISFRIKTPLKIYSLLIKMVVTQSTACMCESLAHPGNTSQFTITAVQRPE